MSNVTHRVRIQNRRARPDAVQLLCPVCGSTVITTTGDEDPNRDWRANSGRASVSAYPAPVDPDPLGGRFSWLKNGFVFSCIHPLVKDPQPPFELALGADEVVRLIGSAQLDGERSAVIRRMPFGGGTVGGPGPSEPLNGTDSGTRPRIEVLK